MKVLLISVLMLVLSACDISELFPKTKTPNLDHFITRDDTTITFKTTDGRDIYIRSNRSTITILSGTIAGRFIVDGSNNLITLEDPIYIQPLTLVGSDNVINAPAGASITVESDTGSGNSLALY